MEKKNYIPSFLIAYLLCIGALNEVMGIVVNKNDGIMIMNLIPVSALMLLHFFISNKERDLNLNKRALLFVYYIVSVIVVHKYAYWYSTFSRTDVLVYCFIPIYLTFYKVDTEKVLRYMTLFSILALPVSGRFFNNVAIGNHMSIGMSTAYNVLPFVFAAILHFIYYRHKAGLWVKVCYTVNIYYLFMVIFYGNRGPIISIMALGILLVLHKFHPDGTMQKQTWKKIAVFILVGSAVIALIYNFENVLYSVYRWFQSMGIEIGALRKSILKLENGDLSNGRQSVFSFTINGIKEHYLIGNGIGTITYNSFGRIIYSHNMFLQLWYDLGIIVSLPMFWLIGKACHKAIFKNSIKKDYAAILMLLFSLSIPRLCYSSEFWGNIPFWLLIMFTISPNLYGLNKIDETLNVEFEGESEDAKEEN